MRLLHIIDSLNRGGAERQLLLLHQNLLAAGHQSVVAYLGPPSSLKEDQPHVPELHDLGVGAGKRQIPAAAAAIRRFVAKVQPEVIHTSLMYSDIAVAGAGLRSIPKVATLCSLSDIGVRHEADPTARPWRMWAANQVWGASLRFAFSRIIAISEAVKDSAIRNLRLPADRFAVIPRAFTYQPDRPPVRDTDCPLIVSVGRLVPLKGHAMLIDALATPAVRRLPWRCEIIGEGAERERLEAQIANLSLGDRIKLVGVMPRAAERVAEASLFVFPSQHEGLGVSAVEAASLSVPSIVSSIPALREIVPSDRYGWLVPPQQTAQWAAAIQQALEDPVQAQEKAKALGARTRARFSPEAMVNATVSVYRQLIDPTTPYR